MMDRLEYESGWQEIIDGMEPGTTTRINHERCTAGEDTRRRLYFTKPAAGGAVLGYCHNCQMGGRFHAESYRTEEFNIEEVIEEREFKDIRETLEYDPMLWPPVAVSVYSKVGLASNTIREYGIGYDAHTNRLCYPIYQHMGFNTTLSKIGVPVYRGYQLRRLNASGNKYITSMVDKNQDMSTKLTFFAAAAKVKETPTNVIVEDLLSGLKIIEAASKMRTVHDVNILVNYGTKINVEAINRLPKGRTFIWFDNDNEHVLKQAERLSRTAVLILKNTVWTIEDYDDPKNQTHENIQRILGWIR